ncbi:MAG: site-2 protease family protein [Rhodospirillales bacterium]|nr:MAG: site-2 protease family protein [Rhodospirillales bacterium]
MFGRSIRLFEIFGFAVKVDASWLILAVLVTWSLAGGYFPQAQQGLSPATYLWMGVAGAAGLFASIIFHELSHSLVARRYGMPIRGITLFIFGGVAEMEDEPPTARAEFLMAVAGPIASGLLALASYVLVLLGEGTGAPVALLAVIGWLSFVNTMLAVFNLVPAFPLDGGRMLRAALWHWTGNIQWATRLSANAGSIFGFVLIALGLLNLVSGNVIGGIWYALIGMFLRAAAASSYMQLQTRRIFEGEPVRRFMVRDLVTVPRDITVQRLVNDFVYVHYHEMFPVVDESGVRGGVGIAQIKQVPREKWDVARVSEIMSPTSGENTVTADLDAVDALKLMRRTGNSRLMVLENGKLVGLVTLKDLLHLISLKMDLEGQQ